MSSILQLPDLHTLLALPLAALLGAALAFRPRRRGTPPRTPAVIQTQVILALMGALVMIVVGASMARAFGIVGAASLIRYRSKISDPKDAGVMLMTLGVGLAAGVGQGQRRHAPADAARRRAQRGGVHTGRGMDTRGHRTAARPAVCWDQERHRCLGVMRHLRGDGHVPGVGTASLVCA